MFPAHFKAGFFVSIVAGADLIARYCDATSAHAHNEKWPY
jgi:hypothetical protein